MARPVKPLRTRRPRGSLTREQVVEAALRIADEDGLEALSMPNIARRLDCGVMTLYGYIEDKGDLLDAIALRGLADLRLARPLPSEPAALLVEWGRALRRTLHQHPSMPLIFLNRAVIGPGIFRGVEALLGALQRGGMHASSGVHAIYAVVTYATGFVAWELARTRNSAAEAAYAASWRREFAGLPPAEFPLTARVLDELPRVAGDQQFEFGLAALAEGLSAHALRA